MPDVFAVILAAGRGTRMKSDLAKVLHPLEGRPLIHHVLDTTKEVNTTRTVLVVGHQADEVREACSEYGVESVLQEQQLGTGHAVQQAAPLLAEAGGYTAVLCGDVPLLRPATLQRLIQATADPKAAATVLTAVTDDATGYGRIVRDDDGRVVAIVEQRDATEDQKRIREYNTGTYCFDNAALWSALSRVGRDNAQGEFYLTDVVSILVEDGLRVEAVICEDEREVQGINSVEDLQRAHRDWEALHRG